MKIEMLVFVSIGKNNNPFYTTIATIRFLSISLLFFVKFYTIFVNLDTILSIFTFLINMKNRLAFMFFLCGICGYFVGISQPLSNQTVSSSVTKATVFFSGAQVVRTAKVQLLAGKHVYVFQGLSPYLNQQTLQIKGEGDFTILSAVQRLNYLTTSENETKIQQISFKLDSIKNEIDRENIQAVVLKSDEELLEKMQNVEKSTAPIAPNVINDALNFRHEKLTELRLKSLKNQQNILKLKEVYDRFYQQMVEANVEKNLSTSEVTVVINAPQSLNTKLEITYFVPKAGWTPLYDFRIKDISSPMKITHKANVYQQTGENWNEISLTLSNADPFQDTELPRLTPWRISLTRFVKGNSEDADNDGVPDTQDMEPFSPKDYPVDENGVALNRLRTPKEAVEEAKMKVKIKERV